MILLLARACLGIACAALAAGSPPADQEPRFRVLRLPHAGSRIPVAFSPDGKTLASGGDDNTIRLWDVATGRELRRIRAHAAAAGISRIGFSPDGKTLLSASWAGDGTVKLWDAATGKRRLVAGRDGGGAPFASLSPDARTLVWGNGRTIRVQDVTTGRERGQLSAPGPVDSVAFSPDGSVLAAAASGGTGSVRLWEMLTSAVICDLPAGQSVAAGSQAVAFFPDGRTLVTATMHGRARLWDLSAGKVVRQFGDPEDSVFCIAISPDGARVAAGTLGGRLYLWETATGKELHRWNEWCSSVAFSPDGNRLAFGTADAAALVRIGAPGRGRGTPVPLKRVRPEEWERLWAALADKDAAVAYRAVWTLSAAFGQAPRWFRERFRPVAPPTARQRARIDRLIADLDDDSYPTRATAMREVEQWGERAEPALRRVLAGQPSLEVRRRVERLVERIARRDRDPESLRALRWLAVLESAGGSDARQELRRLANGSPEARLTQEAKASLRRLARRPG